MFLTTAWRSERYQRQLYRGGDHQVRRRAGGPPLRQHPSSSSHHVTGHAVDVGPTDADDWLNRHGAAYGLCQTYANEIWHFELATDAGRHLPADALRRERLNPRPTSPAGLPVRRPGIGGRRRRSSCRRIRRPGRSPGRDLDVVPGGPAGRTRRRGLLDRPEVSAPTSSRRPNSMSRPPWFVPPSTSRACFILPAARLDPLPPSNAAPTPGRVVGSRSPPGPTGAGRTRRPSPIHIRSIATETASPRLAGSRASWCARSRCPLPAGRRSVPGGVDGVGGDGRGSRATPLQPPGTPGTPSLVRGGRALLQPGHLRRMPPRACGSSPPPVAT